MASTLAGAHLAANVPLHCPWTESDVDTSSDQAGHSAPGRRRRHRPHGLVAGRRAAGRQCAGGGMPLRPGPGCPHRRPRRHLRGCTTLEMLLKFLSVFGSFSQVCHAAPAGLPALVGASADLQSSIFPWSAGCCSRTSTLLLPSGTGIQKTVCISKKMSTPVGVRRPRQAAGRLRKASTRKSLNRRAMSGTAGIRSKAQERRQLSAATDGRKDTAKSRSDCAVQAQGGGSSSGAATFWRRPRTSTPWCLTRPAPSPPAAPQSRCAQGHKSRLVRRQAVDLVIPAADALAVATVAMFRCGSSFGTGRHGCPAPSCAPQ